MTLVQRFVISGRVQLEASHQFCTLWSVPGPMLFHISFMACMPRQSACRESFYNMKLGVGANALESCAVIRGTTTVCRIKLRRMSWGSTKRKAKICTLKKLLQALVHARDWRGVNGWKAALLRKILDSCSTATRQWANNAPLCQKRPTESWAILGRAFEWLRGSDPSPLLSTGKVTARVLCPVRGAPAQERYRYTGKIKK